MLRENTRYLIEVTAESCVLAEFRGICLSRSCKEFVRIILRCLIELGDVKRMLGEM